MKYETGDIIDEKYKYGLPILRVHNKIKYKHLVKTLLILPIHNQIILNVIFVIINSMSTIILCSDFNYSEKQEIYLSKYSNVLTPLGWVEKLHVDNKTYIIMCIIIMIICLIRTFYLFYVLVQIDKVHITEVHEMRINKIVNVINHIVYVMFSYIIQFLSFIYYIEIFPNKFVIKKEVFWNENINKIFMGLNFLFIIFYNCFNFLFIRLAIMPKRKQKISFQMQVHNFRFYYYIILQNLSLLQPLPFYFSANASKIWNICFSFFILILFSIMYLLYVKAFNYDNIINNIISFFGDFCFSSLVIELILYFASLTYKNDGQLISFTIIKIIMAFCLYYIFIDIYGKLMIREVKRELFNKDPNNFSFDNMLLDYILYLREIIINDDPILIRAIRYFQIHQDNCQNKYCSCKVITYAANDEKHIDKNIKYKKQQLIHFMDAIFIKLDFNHKYEFAYILSEHYYLFKKNYVMAYSILQTLLQNEHKNLSPIKIVSIYHSLEKYITSFMQSKIEKNNLYKYINDQSALAEEKKELELKKYFNPILKLKKITKLMIIYSSAKNEVIRYKQNFESSIKIDLDENDNEPSCIDSQIFDQDFISQMIDYLKFENKQTEDLKKLLYDLKNFKDILSLEFFFKCILFIDYFWNAEIPPELVDILYGFTSNKNLYSSTINNKLYEILGKKYNNEDYTTKYYILLKYTNGIIISYISECLIRKLNLKKENVKNKELGSLFIKELINPHNKAVNQYFMTKQHFVIYEKKTHFFNNKKYMISSRFSSTFQIGINKNILILCQTQIDEDNKAIRFFANKNLEIISINQNFENKFNLSLPLIEEFKFEIKDLFDLTKKVVMRKFAKEIIKVKQIKQYIQLDPKEYILKNLFQSKNSREIYKFSEDIIFSNEKVEDNKEEDNEKNHLINRKVKNSFLRMVDKIYNNQIINSLSEKSVNFNINKGIVINKMKKMMEKISLYEQGKLENKNLYQDYLRFHQNYDTVNHKGGVFINLKMTMKLLYDTPFYLCKIQQYENMILLRDNYSFWENQPLSTDSENDSSNSLINLKEEKNVKTVLMDDSVIGSNFLERDKTFDENKELLIDKNQHENLIIIREKIKRKKISRGILRIVEVSFVLMLLVIYIFILIKKMNLVTQADSIFKTLFYTYYQRAQLLYINSVVLSIHFNLVNLTDISSLNENREMLKSLAGNLEEGFHLFYKYYLSYKEGVNEDVEELYRQRMLNKITISWENEEKLSDYIREMQIILYMSLESSNKNFTDLDILDCEYFLLGKFKNNINNNITEVNGNLIRLIYYMYVNYDSVIELFFEELTISFENSFDKYSDNTIITFLVFETAGLVIYLLFFLINFYFLYQANQYIFQNILCLFLDFTQSGVYSFNNKKDNLLIRKYIRNYISLLTEFTPKKLESLSNGLYMNKDTYIKQDLNESVFSEKKEEEQEYKLEEKKDENRKRKPRSKSTLRTKFFLNVLDKYDKTKENLEETDIHNLNNFNLSKTISKKFINRIKEREPSFDLTKTKRTNSTTEKNQNNSSFININTSINDQSKSNITFGQSRKSISFNNEPNDKQTFNIEKVILISKSIIIRIIKVVLIIFLILSVIYVVFYIISIIIGFIIIKQIRQMYDDFRILVTQYNEIIHYWNNMKTLFILPNTDIRTDIYNIEKYFSSINEEVLNVVSNRMSNYKRLKVLYDYLINSHKEEDLLNADFCGNFAKCFELINSTQNILLNGLNSAIAIYEKEIFNYYNDYLKVKDAITTKEDIITNFIKDNFIILGMNINHIISHLEEKFFKDFLEDEKDIANYYHIEIKTVSLISLFYCIFLNIYSLLFIFNYINKNIEFIESSTFRIVSSFCHMKKKIQNIVN